ncbi:MAG: Lar family restriction alleviation protein [Eubacterium sp.]|nr:Lar family restriction alleviation protein [Eubacterium sp.]
MKSKTDLKPCPFCGRKVIVAHDLPVPITFFRCENKSCGAIVSFCGIEKPEPDNVIANWNRRTQ